MATKTEHLEGGGQVKGTMIQAHLGWLKHQNLDPATALRPHLPADLAELVSRQILATSWVPFRSLIAVDRAIAAAVKRSEEEVFRELGRFSAISNLGGVYSGFVSAEPHRFFEKQSRLHGRFQDFGECAYLPTGPRAGQIRLSGHQDDSPVFCHSALGYYQGALETMKAPGPITVRESLCTCAGDEAGVFDLTW